MISLDHVAKEASGRPARASHTASRRSRGPSPDMEPAVDAPRRRIERIGDRKKVILRIHPKNAVSDDEETLSEKRSREHVQRTIRS